MQLGRGLAAVVFLLLWRKSCLIWAVRWFSSAEIVDASSRVLFRRNAHFRQLVVLFETSILVGASLSRNCMMCTHEKGDYRLLRSPHNSSVLRHDASPSLWRRLGCAAIRSASTFSNYRTATDLHRVAAVNLSSRSVSCRRRRWGH